MAAIRVLIVIPTRGDRAEMLQEASESAFSQTVPPVEVVVASGPDPFDVRVNTVIARSDCDAFVLLCDDDKLDQRFIELTTQAMEREKTDIVYTDCHIFGNRNCRGSALGAWTKENLEKNTVPLVTSLCTKSAWNKAGGYRSVKFFDWDFWKRCHASGATAYWLKAPLFWYRDHNGQESKSIQ